MGDDKGEEKVVWPWGMSERDPDPASRPWVFRPRGFLVAVLEDDDKAEEAKAALRRDGFDEGKLRTYAGRDVLVDRERFLAQQGPVRRAVGEITSDSQSVALFADYARNGRSFLWVHVPGREDANRAIHSLSSCGVLHLRYYGRDSLEDIHVR